MVQDPIDILVVEDNLDDFELLALHLDSQGLPVVLRRVESQREMRDALATRLPDLVISDQSLPAFSLQGALCALREHDPDVPFIVVSGAIGEEAAVDAMLNGADDVIMKDNLTRLMPAISRAVGAAKTRRLQRRAELALRERESMLSSLAANLPAMMFRLDFDRAAGRFRLPYAGEGSQRMFGVDPARLRIESGPLLDAIAPEDRETLVEAIAECAGSGANLGWQGRLAVPQGNDERWVQLNATCRGESKGHVYWDGIVYDITDAKRAEREIRELTAHLEAVKEHERTMVAMEIHDDIGALFFGLKVDIAWLKKRVSCEPGVSERLASVDAQLDSGVQASQRIVRSLRPAVLDFGVIGAAQWLVNDFSRRTGIACRFSAAADELALAPELGTAIFRVMQESLTNISRHARATEVCVRVDAGKDEVHLEVLDNGRGFDAGDLGKRGSFGVRGMRERARDLGGMFEIHPAEGGGTRLCLRLPLSAREGPQPTA